MLVTVHLMRYQGRRPPWSEIDHCKAHQDKLQTVCGSGSDRPIAAHLLATSGIAKHLLPDLHDPTFLDVGDEAFMLRGVERLAIGDGMHAVIQ